MVFISQALVAPVQSLPKGLGELVNASTFDDTIPGLLEALQSQPDDNQLVLHSLEEEVVCRSQI
jgi:hypothetical protein